MKIIYVLDEADIKKVLADHFETLPEDVEINHVQMPLEQRIEIVVTNTQE